MNAVTLSDVAQRAGVSQPTASRVLNGSSRKPAPQVAEAVRKAAKELGYIPNAQAQALARATTGLLGLLVHDIADPYFSAIASGVQRAAAERQRQVMLSVTSRSPDMELAGVEAFTAHRTETIIMVGSRWTNPEEAEATERLTSALTRYRVKGGRLAVIGQPLPGASAVVPDNRGGAAALADALVTGGLREFVVLGGPVGLATAVERVTGFVDALANHGLRPRAVLHSEFTRDGGYASTRQAIVEVLPSAPGPRCFFAVNDVMALGAMTALREAGLRVPADAQLAGFDDIPTLRDHYPGLTTVRLPLQAMGEQAVALAIDASTGRHRVRKVSGEIVLRESTGLATAG